VTEGDTVITGGGPPGVPIILFDVTAMGVALGQTTIGEDGRFEFTVDPLESAHRIGVALGELAGTGYTAEELQETIYFGDESLSVPLVGFFYDTAMVREP
jgi:hypothetical protein